MADDPLAFLVSFMEPVRTYLEDDEVSEILINGPDHIYVERRGILTKVPERFPAGAAGVKAAAANIARYVKRPLSEKSPRLDARLPDGSRIAAVIAPVSRNDTIIAIRKFPKRKLTANDLVDSHTISQEALFYLKERVQGHCNLLVSGPTSSGKTTVLNVLSSFIPREERILILEDASELRLREGHNVYMETRPADDKDKVEPVSFQHLLHSALRLRPDRLVLGEIRGAEALDLLQAMNTGHSCLSTIHANSAADSLIRLETCALFNQARLPLDALRRQIIAALDLVVHAERLRDGSRKITQISEVEKELTDDYAYRLRPLFRYDQPSNTWLTPIS